VRYWLRTLAGLAIAGASIVAVDWAIYHLVRTGTCSSGGPYVSARPCPPGTGGHILALIGGIFGGLLGTALYATRGAGGRAPRIGLGLVMWSLLFVTLAGSVAVAAFGPASDDKGGARGVAIVLGAIFLPMGLAPLPFALRGGRKAQRIQQLVESGRRCPGEVLSVEDTNVTINDNPRVRMTVRAEPPGESPFTFVKTATVSRVQIPRAGDRCTVFYDPADPQGRNGITFDPVPGMTPTATATATEGGGSGDDDPLEKIEKLGNLRDRGLITAEEFEQQKRRLLDEV
jgi:hypothetical protein